jgi:hypothetical protein
MAVSGDITFRERWWKQVRADRDVTEGLLAAALVISTVARRDGTRALISNQQLADDLGVSLATVQRRTRELRTLDYLEVVERGHRRGDGTLAANVYALSLRVTQVTARDESQQVTQVTARDSAEPLRAEFSTRQTGTSTPLMGASTRHPDDAPLLNPPLNSPWSGVNDAFASFDAKTFEDWREDDRQLFREVMFVEQVTQRGQRYTIDGLYEAMRKKADWPGCYFQEMATRSEAAIDEYLQTHFDIDRWDDIDRWLEQP